MEVLPKILKETRITGSSSSSHDSGISVGTNSNDSSTGSGDELVKPKEKSSNGIYILPFSPLKERTISEVAVPMFPNHKGSVKFSPPVRMFHRRPHFECGEKMDELLSKLPDYAQFQSEIVRNIYVTPQAPKRQFNQTATKNDPAKSISEMGEILKNKC